MVTQYSIGDFYEKYYDVLLEREAVNQLIIGNLKACIQSKREGTLFAVIEENNTQYFVCHFPPFSMIVTSSKKESNVETERKVGEILANYLIDNDIKVNGINATKMLVQSFVDTYAKKGIPMHKHIEMDIMELTQVNDIKQQGVLEYASIDDLEQLSLFYTNFCVEALGDAPQIEQVREKMTDFINRKILYTLKIDEKIVSMCSTPRKLENGYSISAVYTVPQHRGKGYCKSMIGQLCTKLLNEGQKFMCLFVDRSNPFSNSAYEAVGFSVVGDSTEYVFEKV